MANENFLGRALQNVEKKVKEAPKTGTPEFSHNLDGFRKEFISDMDLSQLSGADFKENLFKSVVAPYLNSVINVSDPDEKRKARNRVAKTFKDHLGSTLDEIYQGLRSLDPALEDAMREVLTINKKGGGKNPL